MEVLVQFHLRSGAADLRVLSQLARGAIRETLAAQEAPADCEISVLYVHDEEMRRLNTEFRGMDEATDVLAFAMRESGNPPMPGAPGSSEMLGDVVVSLDAAVRQAARRGHSARREVATLLIHGALHLAGCDHAEAGAAGRARARTMRAAEKRCIQTLEKKMIV